MADSISQIQSSYEKYKEYFATDTDTNLDQTDFLTLMVEQLKNQDFNNPTDNTQFIAQMAQFTTLQSQQQATYYTQAAYAVSLVGKTVAVSDINEYGNYILDEGVVSSLTFSNNSFEFTVNGNRYSPSNIMEVKSAPGKNTASETKVFATKDVDLTNVDGLSTLISGAPTVTIGFLNGNQANDIKLNLVSGDEDAVTEYKVGSEFSTLTIQLKDLGDITATKDLADRINAAISAEIETPTDKENPMLTNKNFTAGDISITVDSRLVTRADGKDLTEQDLTDINEAAAKTLTNITTGITLS